MTNKYTEFGEEVDAAVEADREKVEARYAEAAAEKEKKEFERRAEKYGRRYGWKPKFEQVEEVEEAEEEEAPVEEPESVEETEVEEVEENHKTAAEVVKDIQDSDDPDEVRAIAEGDDRKTVQKAAEKRLDELE